MKTAFKQDMCFLGVCGHQPFPPLDWQLSSRGDLCWRALCGNGRRSCRPVDGTPAVLSGKVGTSGEFQSQDLD